MKTINITVDEAGLCTLSSDNAGSCGEHNNLTLVVTPNSAFFKNCEYYKLNIDGRYSERLIIDGGELSYTVPQAALCPPEISCQIVGFKTVNDKSVLICRTKTFKLKVEPSPGAYLSINTDAFEPLETAIAHCGNITAVNEEQIAELRVIAADLTTRADEIEDVANGAATEAKDYAEAASSAAAAAAESQAGAAKSASLVSSLAIEVQTSKNDAASSAEAAAKSAAEAAKSVAEAVAEISESFAETTKTLTTDVDTLKNTTEELTTDVEVLKSRVNVDLSGLWGGMVNKVIRELYLDFSEASVNYKASSINKIAIGRNVGGEWKISLGIVNNNDKVITFNESAERYDVITAQNADGVRAYAVIDWSVINEGKTATFSGLQLNSIDEIGAWPVIYAYVNSQKPDVEVLKNTAEELTATTESLAETSQKTTTDVEVLKSRVNVDLSGLWGGMVNKVVRELYLDFSAASVNYKASSINKIAIGRNVGGEWKISLGIVNNNDEVITFNESAERYDVITAQNADGVRAYAVIDWSVIDEGKTSTFLGLQLNSIDEIGAWPAIYAYIRAQEIKNSGGGANGNDGVSPIVEITEIDGGNHVEITDIEGVKSFDVLNGADGKDGVGISKIEKLTSEESFDIYAVYLTDGTYTPITVPKGKNGADGYTPQKGTDYFTEADKQELVAAVIAALPKYEGEVEAV